MLKTLRFSRPLLAAVLFCGALMALPALAETPGTPLAAAQARLHGKQFHNVSVTVEDGIATLAGTVDLYAVKADAEHRVRKAAGVKAVRNHIDVNGATVADPVLENKLLKQLTYDRVGYGNVFNAIGLRVANGVVYLNGHARTPMDKDSALALVAYTKGVKDVVDAIDVDPVSSMDDRARFALYRAVYGFPSLNRYAIDPAKPIRISVQNGHVELYGTVDSEMDKNVAYMEANSVPGVFSVTNHLQVAGKPTERP
jgi:osmotically-inducible protein OsmY